MIYPDTKLEEKLWSKGYRFVMGVDEAGRGPLAGPVVAGAVVIEKKDDIVPDVRDSKKMTERVRERCFELIKEKSLAYGVGIVDSKEIDRVGIQRAVLLAMESALKGVESMLGCRVEYIIADGKNVSLISGYQMDRITKGDLLHYSISAGSVLAKVTRDRIMYDYSKVYPMYGFESHVGYGTKMHLEAIRKYGICEIHRKSFAPIKNSL